MAKMKNRKNNNTKVITLNESQLKKYKNRYIGTIKEFVKDENNIYEMIGAVSMINASLIGISMNQERLEKERDLIIEAYHYAWERMMTSEKNEEKILENWFGDYPLLFRMGSTLEFEKEEEEIEEKFQKLSKVNQHKFNKVFKKIWNTRSDRNLVVYDKNIVIPKTIYRDELEEYQHYVKCMLIEFFTEDNSSLVFTYGKKGKVISAALKNSKGNISVIDIETLKWSYSFDSETGDPINPPENYEFEEFDLEY